MTVSFPRLTFVELRKMVDTRAGFWLQVATALLTLVVLTLFCIFADTEDLIFRDAFALATLPGLILLPIIGILLVSSEWSQRTALITFTLVPKRMRVMSAKIAASLVLGLIVLVIAFVVAAVAIFAVGGEWTLGLGVFGQIALLCLYLDPDRRRVRRRLPELGAGDRPVLRAADRLGGAGLDPVPQRRRAVAGHHPHDGADDRAAAVRRGMAAVRDLAGAVAGAAPGDRPVADRQGRDPRDLVQTREQTAMLVYSIRARIVLERKRQRDGAGGHGQGQVARPLGALGDAVQDGGDDLVGAAPQQVDPELAPVEDLPAGGVDDERRARMGEVEPIGDADDLDRQPRPLRRRGDDQRDALQVRPRGRPGRRAAAARHRARTARTAG